MQNLKVVAVIRTAGERTFEVCRKLLLEQVPAEDVEVVCERPFEKALIRTYKIGIERGAQWTMTLDADVLLRDGAVEKLIAEAEALPDECLQIEGRILDKLTGLYRQAGHRIYRTRFLPDALSEVPVLGEEIRPEYATLETMARRGFPSQCVDLVVGIHDYEQYYRDIYRKAFVHANKHPRLVGELVGRWKRLGLEDRDYCVALRGLYDGLMCFKGVKIDVDAYPHDLNPMLEELGLSEKEESPSQNIDFSFVERVLERAGPPLSLENGAWSRPTGKMMSRMHREPTGQKFGRYYKQLGFIRMIPFLVGVGLSRLGDSIKRVVNPALPPA